jgi:hypothetical protein
MWTRGLVAVGRIEAAEGLGLRDPATGSAKKVNSLCIMLLLVVGRSEHESGRIFN